ncbi:MAG TPA: N-acetyl-gamma-glutamyl-phosphate reductase [Acidimicrobiales bacterium]|nr:N-acetyl-gamma-glutamyl-phosphate reductase [Acidimicrobiales bacterium]
MAKVGIVGASGFAGAELLRLCSAHPELEVAWASASTQAGIPVAELYPNLAGAVGDQAFTRFEPALADGLDLVFLALPHGASAALVPDLRGRVPVVVDLAADFRLRDPAAYEQWYGGPHPAPELLGDFAYGLPELFRPALVGARAVAVPGCYPTAAALALAPLVRAGAVEASGIIVDAASGVSGAGRAAKASTTFCTVDEDFRAYGLVGHRHTPEIEQATGASVLFTPHLAPMNRGILATCYARPVAPTTTDGVLAVLRDAYAGERFVVVGEASPSTKATAGSNAAHLTARVDPRTGWVVVLCALDNLGKGAAGQAVQCANLALGFDEGTGLSAAGVSP